MPNQVLRRLLLAVVALACCYYCGSAFAFVAPARVGGGAAKRNLSPSGNEGQFGRRSHALAAGGGGWFQSAVGGGGGGGGAKAIKKELLQLAQDTQRGVSTSDEQRAEIDGLIQKLRALNPTANSASSPLLSAQWDLQWTTEKEVLFLIKAGLFGRKTGLVYQTIDVPAGSLENVLLFEKESSFAVQSSISASSASQGSRNDFQFTGAKIKYGGLTLPIPPLGKGWFENVYLDKDFRVSIDVRGDVQIALRHTG